ncbi:MAG: DNA cytosine methyltransferase, partial [Muribaculaceae bacterium]|nr:DNA cytosine methyltransferase [Muribaculaceae bacterium]
MAKAKQHTDAESNKEAISEVLGNFTAPLSNESEESATGKKRLLSLFSGCGGMDIGFEGGFICNRKSVNPESGWIEQDVNADWVKLRPTQFKTIFANDILEEAKNSWISYMVPRGHAPETYHFGSIVDYVKDFRDGKTAFPTDIDIVTGGFPCQDFSVAGKRKGFESNKDHTGKLSESIPSEETRGKLYFWMKQVIDITRPKVFVAENVKGLMNLGDVKTIIQNDFANAAEAGYIVLTPRVLHAANFGVPESRERVIFIGLRKDALREEAIEALEKEEVPDEYNPYPSPTHGYNAPGKNLMTPVVCGDVFKDLAEPEDSADLSQSNYSKAKYMGSHCQGQKEISLGKIGPTIRSEHHGNIEYRRLSAEHGGEIDDELKRGLKERRLTPRECALIQTFPPDYKFVRRTTAASNSRFVVSASGAYKVIGNAVPP